MLQEIIKREFVLRPFEEVLCFRQAELEDQILKNDVLELRIAFVLSNLIIKFSVFALDRSAWVDDQSQVVMRRFRYVVSDLPRRDIHLYFAAERVVHARIGAFCNIFFESSEVLNEELFKLSENLLEIGASLRPLGLEHLAHLGLEFQSRILASISELSLTSC